MCPMKRPTKSPHPKPMYMIIQSVAVRNWSESSSSCSENKGGNGSPHFFDKGFPHNPGFPSYELFSKESNCFPCGMGPVRWLCETSRNARTLSWVSCRGISPESLFCERSSDSRLVRFPKDEGMEPIRALFERLSSWAPQRYPMVPGISPSNLLLDRSMALNRVWIL